MRSKWGGGGVGDDDDDYPFKTALRLERIVQYNT